MSKSKIFVLVFFAALMTGLASYRYLRKPEGDKNAVIMQVMTEGIESQHYNPLPIDDKFSEKVFTLFFDRLDNNKKIFLKSDITYLSKYKEQIDDEITNGSSEFFQEANRIFVDRMAQVKKYYPVILAKPFDFTSNESMESDGKKLDFPADTTAQKEAWRKYLKYQTMTRLAEMVDNRDKAAAKSDTAKKDTTYAGKTDAQLEAMARARVLKNYNESFDKMNEMDDADRMNIYIGCMANVQDPHTEFFPPAEKQNFDIAMTGKLEGIGAQLQQKDGVIKVTSIVVGSPSYKDGKLKQGDIIVKVAQGDQDYVDISDMRLDKAIQLIRGKKGTVVRLSVKKPDGSMQEIRLVRDVIVVDDTYAKSAVIDNSGGKIGYIRLPIFYADFDNSGGRDCSSDVKKELEKLKAENVRGVIIDLRDNGGGSLENVVDMVGLFIPKGPIVQVKSKTGAASLMNDNDTSVTYRGPLVVMVNENSASASEIFAAAIEDYKRGIVMGSPTTFGKGTVQRIFDMDRFINDAYAMYKPLGSVKITMQKFYRISGGSTQLRGVTPDIIVPDVYSYIKYGEKQEDFPMGWDEIPKAKYTEWTPAINYKQVEENSKKRIEGQTAFAVIDNEAKELKQESDNTVETLNLKKYQEQQKKFKDDKKSLEDLQKNSVDMNISNLNSDLTGIQSDSAKIARNKEWLKSLKKDIYLNEASKVTEDLK